MRKLPCVIWFKYESISREESIMLEELEVRACLFKWETPSLYILSVYVYSLKREILSAARSD